MINPHAKRAHHSGKRFMRLEVAGRTVVLPAELHNRSSNLECVPCKLLVNNPDPNAVCPRCQRPLSDPAAGSTAMDTPDMQNGGTTPVRS